MAKTWTNQELMNEGKLYTTRGAFVKGSNSAYIIARKRGILDQVCAHMTSVLKKRTNEELAQIAKKYESKIDFLNNENDAYNAAYKRGILKDICSHMQESRHEWTLEETQIEANKYPTKSKFQKNSPAAFSYALRRGWIHQICAHMMNPQITRTNEEIASIASQYLYRSDFQQNDSGAYQAAQARGILDQVCAHMHDKLIYWDMDKVKAVMKDFKGCRSDLKSQHGSMVQWLRQNNILKDIYKEYNIAPLNGQSRGEIEMREWVKTIYPSATSKWFNLVDKKGALVEDKTSKHTTGLTSNVRREIDIFIPELNLGIEYHGLYIHSEVFKERQYHLKKRELFAEIGITLIQIYENEWRDNQSLIKSMLMHKMGLIKDRLFVKDLIVKSVGRNMAKDFLQSNHLMGHYRAASYTGLFNKNELVAIIGVKKKGEGIDISRFCTKQGLVIPGAMSKLLAVVTEQYTPKTIYYDVDLRYGSINGALSQGFELSNISLGWHWTDFDTIFDRRKCMANMDERRLTEKEYAHELDWYKIYDAGQAHLVKKI